MGRGTTEMRIAHSPARWGTAFLVLLLGFLLLLPGFANAQATGTVSGLVTDSSNAVLPQVAVEITNAATGLVRTSSTGPDGVYVVPLLPPGMYEVKATLAGFTTLTRKGVRVSVSETARVDLALSLGARSDAVTVTADAPLVETGHATLGIVIGEDKILDLPLNGRSFAQLGTLVPGVVASSPDLGGTSGDATPGGLGNPTGSFNVNGMGNTSNNFLLDGATNNDTLTSGFVLRPPPDAIQEFKILTHSYNAEFGRNSGSIVDVATKAGTNAWHATAWEFNRDDALQARNYFADPTQPKPLLNQNQFGASGGGPIARNRFFAFGYYEGFRRRAGSTNVLIVPTAAQRRGDFSGEPPVRDPDTGESFPGNVIPPERLDPIALRLLNDFVPLPNSGLNRYNSSPIVVDDRDQAGLRLDYRPSGRHSLLGRYLWSHTEAVTPPTVQPAAQVAKATLQDAMLSYTYLASSNAINVVRVSANRIHANPMVTSGVRNADYGINLPNTNPGAVGLANIAINGVFDAVTTMGDHFRPFLERSNDTFQAADDFTWLRGRHSFKFGLEVRRERMRIAVPSRPNGNLQFTGGITGNPIADFLLGRPSVAAASTTQATQDGHRWIYAGYAQDQFRPDPRLTVNVGVRYELAVPFVDANDAMAGIDMRRQSTRYPQAPRGLVYPGDPGVPRGIVPTDANNIAPRLGVVWDPTGQGRTSLRAGWGKFYDTLPGSSDFFVSSAVAPPFTPLLVLVSPTPITLGDPLAALAGGPALFPPNLTVVGWGTDFQLPSAYHYNLGVQHQLGRHLGVEVGYVGSRGYDQPLFIEINPGLYQPGQTTRGARLYPAYAIIRPTFSVGRSWYDALQASARLRTVRGLDFLASYTWSHAIDHASATNLGTESRPVLPAVQGDEKSVVAALVPEKGDALFDVRHRFVLSFGYQGPQLTERTALVRALLGGWQLNGIFQAQTGFPFTVTEGSNLDIRYLTGRPDVTCDPNHGPRTPSEWFDTSCFLRRTLVETGERPGNEGRNVVRGPGFSRTDVALLKNFGIAARHRVQLRLEVFNLFNQPRLGQPGLTIGTPTFGVITSTADDNRIFQLGIKYSF